MITLECLLEFETKEDINAILDLMRRFSSAMRYAYKRLLESEERKDLKKNISRLFNINTRYSDDAILLAKQTIEIYKSHNKNPKKVIFGSRALFNKLNKKHLRLINWLRRFSYAMLESGGENNEQRKV